MGIYGNYFLESPLTKADIDKYNDKMENLADKTGEERIARLAKNRDNSSYQKFRKDDNIRNNIDITRIIDENTYLVSDLHFGKNGKVEDNKYIRILNKIPSNGVLLILGDIGYVKEPVQSYLKDCFDRIKCENRFLILGNHDCYSLDYYYNDLKFKGIYEIIYMPKKNWIFSHQPCNGPKPGLINFHGHIHEDTRYDSTVIESIDNKINVWCGYLDKDPRTLIEWIEFSKSIEKQLEVM